MAKSRASGATSGENTQVKSFLSQLGNRVKITQKNGENLTFVNIGNNRIASDNAMSNITYDISSIPGGLQSVFGRAAKVEVMGPEPSRKITTENYQASREARRQNRLNRASRAPGARHFTR